MTKWQYVKLGDVCSIIDGDRGKNYPKENDFSKSGYCLFLNTKNVPNTKFDFSDCLFISEEKDNSLRKGKIKYGDIVVTTRGTLANFAYYTQDCKFKNIRINSGMVILRNEKQCIYTPYLYHFLMSINFKQQVNSFASGSAQPQLPIKDMKNITIPFPPVDMQRKIAEVLRVLDAKIELNNAINNNLEQQAQALFKSWFVDFEPFGGKMPSDWKLYKLGEFVPVITGKKNANVSSSKGKYPFFSCSQNAAWTNNYSFDGNAILVAGNGDFNVKFYNGKFEAYQRTYVLMPHNLRYTDWLYYAVKHNLSNITSNARGSVISFITKGNLENFEFAAPSDLKNFNLIDAFSSINKISLKNKKENEKLAELRDALLPKLMSGEIDVSNVNIDDLASADKLSFTKE